MREVERLRGASFDSTFALASLPTHSLVRYYIRAGQLPPSFKYEADKASAIVS